MATDDTQRPPRKLARSLLSVHRWCSVFVALNFIVLSLTGLVLIFHEEIDETLGDALHAEVAEGPRLSPLGALALAQKANPDLTPLYLFQDRKDHPGIVYVGLAPRGERFETKKLEIVDVHSEGKLLPNVDFNRTFTGIVFRIHADLFLGPLGRFLVGALGLAILVSLVTGFFVYGPTMKRFFFGMVRRDRSRRIVLADLHKILGASAFGWNFVVATTGVLLCFSGLILQLYAARELASVASTLEGAETVRDLASLDEAVVRAEEANAGKHWQTIVLPGAQLSTPRHYAFLLRGDEGRDEHTFAITLVDAAQPSVVTRKKLPWWLDAVFLSEPLHFGNYGGLPLKILWAMFSTVTLALSVTGVWVFFLGRKKRKPAPT